LIDDAAFPLSIPQKPRKDRSRVTKAVTVNTNSWRVSDLFKQWLAPKLEKAPLNDRGRIVYHEGTSEELYKSVWESSVFHTPTSWFLDSSELDIGKVMLNATVFAWNPTVGLHRLMPHMPCPVGGFEHETLAVCWNPNGPVRLEDPSLSFGIEYRHKCIFPGCECAFFMSGDPRLYQHFPPAILRLMP